MVKISTSIENDFFDSGVLCFFSNKKTNFLGLLTLTIEVRTLEIFIIG